MSQVRPSPGVRGIPGKEAGTTSTLRGCVQLSMELANKGDFAVFRTFEDLNMLKLLILQAELARLRSSFLSSVSGEDWDDNHDKFIEDGRNSADFSRLKGLDLERGFNPRKEFNPIEKPDPEKPDPKNGDSKKPSDDELQLQQILSKLKEYNTALLQFAQIRELSRPNKAELKSLEKRADNDEDDKDEDDNGEKLPPLAKLRGSTLIAWNKSCFEDLITFKRPLLGLTAAIDSAVRTNLTDPLKERLSKSKPGHRSFETRPTRADRIRSALFVSRLFMALFAAIALIGPTLIMSLHASLHTSLITTSVATILFGLILAFGATDSRGQDVLGATAAYCAVLIVFVGTSLSVKAS